MYNNKKKSVLTQYELTKKIILYILATFICNYNIFLMQSGRLTYLFRFSAYVFCVCFFGRGGCRLKQLPKGSIQLKNLVDLSTKTGGGGRVGRGQLLTIL